jgi:hypothetical protein
VLLQAYIVVSDFLFAFIFVFGEEALVSQLFCLLAHAAWSQFLGRFLASFDFLRFCDFTTTHRECYEQNYKISKSNIAFIHISNTVEKHY